MVNQSGNLPCQLSHTMTYVHYYQVYAYSINSLLFPIPKIWNLWLYKFMNCHHQYTVNTHKRKFPKISKISKTLFGIRAFTWPTPISPLPSSGLPQPVFQILFSTKFSTNWQQPSLTGAITLYGRLAMTFRFQHECFRNRRS